MTALELKNFYVFASLEFSTEEVSVQQLKKVLLLEIKSAENGVLTIGGKVWSKNDLLQAFETAIPQVGGNTDEFEKTNPWISLLREPVSIKQAVKITPQIKNNSGYQQFCSSESDALFPAFKRTVKTRMDENNLMGTYALLSYLPIFSDEHQFELCGLVKSLFYGKYKTIDEHSTNNASSVEDRFFNFPVYYDILRIVAGDDSEFLHHQLEVFQRKIKTLAQVDTKKIALKQLALPFPPDVKEWLQSLVKAINKDNERRIEAMDDSSGGRSNVWLIITVIIIVLRLVLYFSRH